MNKLTVALLFGGKSAEHEISLISARNVYEAIDKEKFSVVLIGIDKNGKWLLQDEKTFLSLPLNANEIVLPETSNEVSLTPQDNKYLLQTAQQSLPSTIDVVFPLIHGPYGEDGSLQGLLKLANLPFVGAGVLGSAIGMDKDVMKRLLQANNIPVGEFLVFTNPNEINVEEIITKFGLPLFVKPANMGSSIGVSKINNKEEFQKAIELAFSFDTKILIEKYIKAREIEVAVLGNDNLKVTIPGEIIVKADWYTYQAKYTNEEEASLEIPAKLTPEKTKEMQDLAIKTFKTLCCEGMARVDFFMDESELLYVREINTIPGFTKRSMYPRLWEESGISYSELIAQLIELAIERYTKQSLLKTSL